MCKVKLQKFQEQNQTDLKRKKERKKTSEFVRGEFFLHFLKSPMLGLNQSNKAKFS